MMKSENRSGNNYVNVGFVFEKEGVPTGVAAIIVEKSGNNAITVVSGASFVLVEEDIEQAEIALKKLISCLFSWRHHRYR